MKLIYIFGFLIVLFLLYNLKKDNKKQNIDINDILKSNYYINLEHRKDKNEINIKELKKIGINNPNRFNAIKKDNGAIGCYMSHLEVLKKAKKNNWDYVTVFEDDVLFLKPKETLQKLDKIVNSDIDWDVIILGGHNYPPYKKINDDCIKVNNCQSTTSYIVKQSYYDTLINHWEKGLKKLIETNDKHRYAIDMYWKLLQKKDNFYAIIPMDVIQYPGYSDIDKKNVDWTKELIDYQKKF